MLSSREEQFQRERDRIDEEKQIPVLGGGGAIRPVLPRAVMTKSDLVLIIQPVLIGVGTRGVQDPLPDLANPD